MPYSYNTQHYIPDAVRDQNVGSKWNFNFVVFFSVKAGCKLCDSGRGGSLASYSHCMFTGSNFSTGEPLLLTNHRFLLGS